jgi:hypothetical protein
MKYLFQPKVSTLFPLSHCPPSQEKEQRIETDVTYILQNFDTVKFLRFGMFYDDSTLFTAYAKDGSWFVFRPGYKANKFFISKVFSRNADG